MPSFSPTTDLFDVADNIELVTLLNDLDAPIAINVRAYRSPISSADQQRFEATTDPRNVTFSLDASVIAEPPPLHGTIIDSHGMPFEIIVAQQRTSGTRWKCITRDVSFCTCTPPADELPEMLPIRGTWLHADSYVLAGADIATSNNSSQNWYSLAAQTPADLGDKFSTSFVVAEGEYKLHFYGATGANCGKVDWRIDGQLIAGSQDWYAAGAGTNAKKTVAGLDLERGRHVLTGQIVDKHAASSDYFLNLTRFAIEPAQAD